MFNRGHPWAAESLDCRYATLDSLYASLRDALRSSNSRTRDHRDAHEPPNWSAVVSLPLSTPAPCGLLAVRFPSSWYRYRRRFVKEAGEGSKTDQVSDRDIQDIICQGELGDEPEKSYGRMSFLLDI